MTLLAGSFILTGCDKVNNYYDDTPPAPPKNVYTVTGDNRIDIFWDYNIESDVAGYNVYYAYSYDGKYTLIGHTQKNSFIDYDAKNGVTYYYAVTAYDYDFNESELSKDVVYDTPRPEGFNQTIYDYLKFPNNSGYDFSKYLVLAYDHLETDLFFENYNGKFYLNVWDDSDIQDMGTSRDIWDVSYAPTGGWVPVKQGENVKYTDAIVGHTYVIWTWDNHYAKVRIKNITNERVVFDWAYQLVAGNRELKRGKVSNERGSVPKEVIKKY
ncbi:MAG: hypothetical protein CVV24_01615 [Ignavibacteriae bacterium HGW-Ignavibacteriae-3]|nr:MAG: hypothetical protein CVV24_01615 [Ignavibacteriae bacterium HGW-Ignavibacteriae-3]